MPEFGTLRSLNPEPQEKFERAAGVRAVEYRDPHWEMYRGGSRGLAPGLMQRSRGYESARIEPPEYHFDGTEEADAWEGESESDDEESDVDEDWVAADVAADMAADVDLDLEPKSGDEDAGARAQPEPAGMFRVGFA